jgi:capsular exopolysaccharide synthesis family protein
MLPPGNATPHLTVPTFGSLLHALKRRWVLATFIGILVAVAASVVTWISMPAGKHMARATLRISRPVSSTDEAHRVFKDNQFQQLKSRYIINMVLGNKEVADLPSIREAEDKPRFIEDSLEAKWVGDDTLRVSMNGNNAEDLRVILEKLLSSVIESAKSDVAKKRTARMKSLLALQERLSREIDGYAKDLKTNATGIAGVVPSNDGNQTQLQTYEKIVGDILLRVNAIDIKSDSLDKQLKRVSDELGQAAPPVPPEFLQKFVAQDPRIKRLTDALDQKVDSLKKVKETFAATSPVYTNAEKAVAEAEKELKAARTGIGPEVERLAREEYKKDLQFKQADYAGEIEQMKAEKSSCQSQMESVLAQMQNMKARVVENQNIRDKMKPLQADLDKIKTERRELEYQVQDDQRITVFDEPTVYLNQSLKQKAIASAAAAVTGFLGILALVGYLEWRTRRVDSVDQVMNELGMRVIGTIPAFPSKAAVKSGSAETNQNWRFILNESVNSTRTLLLHTAKTQSMQVIMVTSAMQGEGKTSLASQLATSMATAGLRTLILDCDMRNPSVHRLFDVALTPGCSEILCQEVDVSDAVQPTSVPNLWMIPAGQCSNRVVAALAQGHPLETLFNRLRGQFDFVVVDCCPVLPVADALLIGQHVDGVVFSILQDISQLPKVIDASKRLTSLNIPLLGAVVNGIKVDMHTYGYNYVKQLPA